MTSPTDRRDQLEEQQAVTTHRKRSFSSVPKLTVSLSCPHLPLLSIGASSPPEITPAVGVGAITPTTEIFATFSHSKRAQRAYTITDSTGISTPVLRARRVSMSGFPWGQEQSASGQTSPAAEFVGELARRGPVTPPAQSHNMTSSVLGKRGSPKANLRLRLPPLGMDAMAAQLAGTRRGSSANETVIGRHKFGHMLLGLPLPATPDVVVSHEPVIYEAAKVGFARMAGSSHIHESGPNDGPVSGMVSVGAQRALVAMAMLTPPDDSEMIEWQPLPVPHTDPSIQAPETPERSTETTAISSELNQLQITETSQGETTGSRGTTPSPNPSQQAAAASEQSAPHKLEATGSGPRDRGWIMNAMNTLFGPTFRVSLSTESIRILSYTLPCPLPGAPGTGASRANPVNPDRLPTSALQAPSVAAAAGHTLSPALASRCSLKGGKLTAPLDPNRGVTSALPAVTSIIQEKCPGNGSNRLYIHIHHVIDPTIPISRLPSTPPINSAGSFAGSPGQEGGDEGYFAPSVFNSIVVAPNTITSDDVPGTPIRTHPPLMPTGPNLILPPSSLHITLMERYIPPTTKEEDISMFNRRTSPLVDRILELSPDGGSLIFIYPTKSGAEQFINGYLGPVIDPLLRKMLVLYSLHSEVLWKISSMESTESMAEFTGLRNRLKELCSALTAGHTDRPPTPTRLVYADTVEVYLNDYSWREWWSTQESGRIHNVVKTHFANQPSPETRSKKETEGKSFWPGYGVPGDLAREVLDGVKAVPGRVASTSMKAAVMESSKNAMGDGRSGSGGATGNQETSTQRRKGIEVGVFVLQRGNF
ncbi:hypothetical protein EX30DRAFT_348491 [Ascodesmis nigricans]|uniref:Uncharacterized protein n=1 Tax=Ascodesmis nigricans TaxID=341454 RepID=A0A4S2MYJ4_9PEZI|nr:hypothetical protein EX30DRAFT_348491 [Ascodesmis nigricans]